MRRNHNEAEGAGGVPGPKIPPGSITSQRGHLERPHLPHNFHTCSLGPPGREGTAHSKVKWALCVASPSMSRTVGRCPASESAPPTSEAEPTRSLVQTMYYRRVPSVAEKTCGWGPSKGISYYTQMTC